MSPSDSIDHPGSILYPGLEGLFNFHVQQAEELWQKRKKEKKRDNIYNFYLRVPNIHLTTLRIE